MKNYRLIKEYPESSKLGTIETVFKVERISKTKIKSINYATN